MVNCPNNNQDISHEGDLFIINLITKTHYMGPTKLGVHKFEDPIQSCLRKMEESNPSLNAHAQNNLEQLIDQMALLDRPRQYHKGKLDIICPDLELQKIKDSQKENKIVMINPITTMQFDRYSRLHKHIPKITKRIYLAHPYQGACQLESAGFGVHVDITKSHLALSNYKILSTILGFPYQLEGEFSQDILSHKANLSWPFILASSEEIKLNGGKFEGICIDAYGISTLTGISENDQITFKKQYTGSINYSVAGEINQLTGDNIFVNNTPAPEKRSAILYQGKILPQKVKGNWETNSKKQKHYSSQGIFHLQTNLQFNRFLTKPPKINYIKKAREFFWNI